MFRRFSLNATALLLASAALLSAAVLRVSAAGLAADPALREARLDERACDAEGAARMYSLWLAANSSSPRAAWAFERYFALEQDLPALIDASKRFLAAQQNASGHGALFLRIARLLEVSGMTEDARNSYLRAFEGGAGPEALEAAFLLSLEMNDLETMARSLASLKNAGGAATAFQDACLAYQKGDAGPARDALRQISEQSSDQETSLKALWLGYEIAARMGDAKAAAAAADKLRARFPQSPEYAMAARALGTPGSARVSVVSLPVPGGFFSGPPGAPVAEQPREQGAEQGAGRPAEQSAQSAATPAQSAVKAAQPAAAAQPGPPQAAPSATQQSAIDLPAPVPPPAQQQTVGTLSVQAGSFSMKENADDLVSQLTRGGFSPTVRTETLQGKQLYRVYAGSLLTPADARALLDRLHAQGFSGFLVSDAPH